MFLKIPSMWIITEVTLVCLYGENASGDGIYRDKVTF